MDNTDSLPPQHPFLSVIRGQTFDLLLHLSLNLPQPIRLSGPVGIGKTHFLRTLERQAAAHATVCYQVASAGLSLERLLDTVRIKAEIELQRAGYPFGSTQNDIHSLLDTHTRNKQSLLLLLDDAQTALPGLLDGLSQFAGLNPALKLVVALNDTAISDKAVSDPEFMNEAFQIEIPALGQSEAIAYIRYVVATSPAFLPGETFGPAFHDDVFSASGGSPGQIEACLEQPRAPSRRQSAPVNVGFLAGTGLLITLVAGLTLYFGQGRESIEISHSLPVPVPPPPATPVVDQPPPEPAPPTATTANETPPGVAPEPVRPTESPASTPVVVIPEPRVEPVAVPAPQVVPVVPVVPVVKTPEPGPASAVIVTPAPPETTPQPVVAEIKAPATPAKSPPPPTAAVPVIATPPTRPPLETALPARLAGETWIMSQPAGAYTLQVATASNDEQIRKFMREHPAGKDWSSLSIRQGGRTLYPLYQGVYPDLPSAERALRQWERGAKKAFIRRFASLQQPPGSVPGTARQTDQPVTPVLQPPTVSPDVDRQDIPPAGVAIQPLEALPEINVEKVQTGQPQPEAVEDDTGEAAATPNPGKEIYYRLIEGQAPRVEIIDPAQPPPPTPPTPVEPPPQSVPPAPAASPEKSGGAILNGADWLQAQPAEYYTLQIITVSSVEARNQVIRQFPANAQLASYPVRRSQGLVYPVFYGIYTDVAAARLAMSQIPRQLGSTPMLRQFKTLQREIGPTLSP